MKYPPGLDSTLQEESSSSLLCVAAPALSCTETGSSAAFPQCPLHATAGAGGVVLIELAAVGSHDLLHDCPTEPKTGSAPPPTP